MKKFLNGMGIAFIGLIGIVLSLATSTDLTGSGSGSLNTRKIDKNIDELRELEWFNALCESERHNNSFEHNNNLIKSPFIDKLTYYFINGERNTILRYTCYSNSILEIQIA